MSTQPATGDLDLSSLPVEFNPFLPEFRENPYPFYHRLRSVDPVHWSDIAGRWVLTRYGDCVAVLRDATRFSADPNTWSGFPDFVAAQGGPGPLMEMQTNWMLMKDPPDHTRLRMLVTKAFTPRVAEGMRPRVQAIVDNLLDDVQAAGHMDLIANLAFPLPTIVICEMLGVPVEDREQFKGWTRDLARSLDPIVTPEIIAAADQATVAFADYFRSLVATRRKNPQNDLLSGLIAAEERGDHLTEDELLATAILLLGAGHETTMNLIGNGTLALLCNPDQLTKLQHDPTLMPSAVEEFLRYDGSVQMTARTALTDVEIGGKTIPKGVQAIIILGAANRDPAQFLDPDRLDITRPDNRHIVFSYGIHHCLGAPLARVEGQVTINTLLRRMPNLRLTGEPLEWRETVTLRGLKALPVTF
jgi:pimeloyl-[acyl-carrier protein] synthase